MDDIYMLLISIDFPDAVTRGLRRSADQTRGLLERTRGDLTVALRQRHLENRMVKLEKSINRSNTEHS
jgi:translin